MITRTVEPVVDKKFPHLAFSHPSLLLYESSKGDFWFFSKFENTEKIEQNVKNLIRGK